MLVSAVAALLALSQVPPSFNPLVADEPAHLTAETSLYDGAQHVVKAEGHCTLSSPRASVKADRLVWDQLLGKVTAQGHAIAVTGLDVAIAEELTVDLETSEVFVLRGQFFEKKGVPSERLRLASTQTEVESLGVTTMAVTGSRFRKLGPHELGVRDLQMTPCDCDPLKPHWYIRSSSGDVVAGDHAWLYLPVIYVYGVPVFALPVLNIPLTNRKSGLLVPKPVFSSQNGFSLQVPYFITLGPTYDATLTPGYFFGNGAYDPAKNFLGVQGPNLGMEFRYANTAQINTVSLNLLDDLKAIRSADPNDLGSNDPKKLPRRGLRGTFSWRHAQDLGSGFHDRVDLSFLSDGYLLRDITTDVLQRTNEYTRSTATVNRRGENQYEGLDVALRQDIRYGFSFFGRQPDGIDGTMVPKYGPNPLDRLPAFTFAIPDSKLAGPVFGSLQIEAARLAPLFGLTGDEGQNGFYDLSNPATPFHGNPGQGDRVYQPGEREARDRLDLHPTVDTQLSLGSALRLRPFASLREDVYQGEVTGSSQQRGYGLLGAQASTELSRVFAGGTLRHAITPSAEFHYVPFFFGSPLLIYDEIDRSLVATQNVPAHTLTSTREELGGLSQEVFQVSQSLQRRTGNLVQEVARLDVGQELDSRAPGKLGDTFGLARVNLGPLLTQGALRYDVKDRRVTQASVSAHLADRRRDSLDVRYDGVIDGGSTRQRQGIDMLVGTPYLGALSTDISPLRHLFSNQLTVGANATLAGGIGLHYDLLTWTSNDNHPLSLAAQTAGLVFAPACDCWRLDVFARVNAGPMGHVFGTSELFFSLTINHFGSFGNSG